MTRGLVASALALSLWVVTACVEEPTPHPAEADAAARAAREGPGEPPGPGGRVGGTEPVAGAVELPGADTTTTSEVDPESEALAQVETVPGAAVPVPRACRGAVPWAAIPTCLHEAHVYASGRIAATKDPSLARAAAGARARAALLGAPAAGGVAAAPRVVEHGELLDLHTCKGTTYALARRPKTAADAGLPACDAGVLEKRSPLPKGCPEWTRSGAWLEGDVANGVGVAAGIKGTSLADAVAVNRARAEIAKMLRTELSGEGTSNASAEGFMELARTRALCDGAVYVKLVVRTVADTHHAHDGHAH